MKMNISTISNVMETAILPPKFKKYSLSMLIADNETKKIIDGTIPLNNALNKVQKKLTIFYKIN